VRSGTGYQAIAWVVAPDRSLPLLLGVLALRCLATTATVTGGGAGGLFVPLVVAGALLGRVVGGALQELDTTLFLVIGIAAFLGGGYRVPLAAVMSAAGEPVSLVPAMGLARDRGSTADGSCSRIDDGGSAWAVRC